jgi:hypothetical protein
MKIRVQVVIESELGPPLVEEVAALERGALRPEELGLRLEEAKDLLRAVQHTMIAQQVEEYVDQQVRCPECDQPRPRKGKHEIVFCTLFGKLKLPSPRLYACRIIMRLTVMGQTAKGLALESQSIPQSDEEQGEVPTAEEIQKQLERVK